METRKAGYFPTLSTGADWTSELSKKPFPVALLAISTDQYQLAGTLSGSGRLKENQSNKRATMRCFTNCGANSGALRTQVITGIVYQLVALDAQQVANSTLDN
jgi:hypothetical protein